MNISSTGMFQFQSARSQQVLDQGQRSAARQEELMNACEQFESIFIKQMLDSMRDTVPETGMMDGGMGEDVFEDMLYDEYAQSMTQNGRLGLARQLYDQLSNYV
ncbi:MAG: rod-binding protein [Spirochaetia bacterium]